MIVYDFLQMLLCGIPLPSCCFDQNNTCILYLIYINFINSQKRESQRVQTRYKISCMGASEKELLVFFSFVRLNAHTRSSQCTAAASSPQPLASPRVAPPHHHRTFSQRERGATYSWRRRGEARLMKNPYFVLDNCHLACSVALPSCFALTPMQAAFHNSRCMMLGRVYVCWR